MDESRFGSLPLVTHAVALESWSLAIGAAAGFVAGLPTALIGDRVAPPFQGVAIGWLRTVTDGGHILGPVVMGALADATHLSTPFVFAAALLMAIAWRCRRRAIASSAST
jgi:MFS family permease